MKVGPHVMTHGHNDREIVPRVGANNQQPGGNFKLIQCQLMLLLHARRCQQRQELILSRNNANPNTATNSMARALLLNCPVRHCRAMTAVLNHMKTCRLGGTCTYNHCTTSLRILSHWTNCTIEDCPLCQSVRQRMRRAKEWEQSLPRSSRYTLLAAALRSSQATRPVAPNCNAAEQAQEAQSGFPCQSNHEELRSCPNANDDSSGSQKVLQNSDTKDVSVPSLDQVRKAYEQLGIPCPEAALQRLMATLPSSSSPSHEPERRIETDAERENKMDQVDQGVFDCSPSRSSEPEQNQPCSSKRHRYHPFLSHQPQHQHPLITSTNSILTLPPKSSSRQK